MRRTHKAVALLLSTVFLSVPEGAADAQASETLVAADALVTGVVHVSTPPPVTGRTSSSGSFEGVTIQAVGAIEVDGDRIVAVTNNLSQPAGATIDFQSDDDVTDGSGTILPISEADEFVDTEALGFAPGVAAPDVETEFAAVLTDDGTGTAGDFVRVGSVIDAHMRTHLRIHPPWVRGRVHARLRMRGTLVPQSPAGDSFLFVAVASDAT